MRQNCWEFNDCGRTPGGAEAGNRGVCPASTYQPADGLNGGRNAGRICWAVSGTFCQGEVQGTFAEKKLTCMTCRFFKKVKQEEASGFRLLLPGQRYIA